jgi:hypothetical protein
VVVCADMEIYNWDGQTPYCLKLVVSLTGFLSVMAPISAPILGVHFFGGCFPPKMGRFAPFLATIQALSKTCVSLFNKRSEGCFVLDAPPLVLARAISIIAPFS